MHFSNTELIFFVSKLVMFLRLDMPALFEQRWIEDGLHFQSSETKMDEGGSLGNANLCKQSNQIVVVARMENTFLVPFLV